MKKIFYKLFLEKTDNLMLQFFRYIFVGGFAAIVNIGGLFLLTEILHVYYLLSNVIGFLLGLIVNYLLSKWLIFTKEAKMNALIEFIVYAMIGAIGLGLDTFFMWLFTSVGGIYYMLSKIISTGLVFIWNFFGRKGIYVIVDKRKGKEEIKNGRK